jgi:superoxide dismutase
MSEVDVANIASRKESWLKSEIFDDLIAERDEAMRHSTIAASKQDLSGFAASQNRAMLLKFFLEQAFGSTPPGEATRRILDRDFDGFDSFKRLWVTSANDTSTEWLILALSFCDFRFHLFVLGNTPIPFCISPIMCSCCTADIVSKSALSRNEFNELQWANLNWNVVEQRANCLQEPLELFEEPQQCCTTPIPGQEHES